MTATYTFDIFTSLDGFGSVSGGDWGGYWGKQGARPNNVTILNQERGYDHE